ncbi:CRISPR-associated protein Csc1 [hydrothermal vent metagenome]|uniref:CRISPR-associated protein Csc1 n=1 Tax=hydrothermal vent metagenome TaxID=652676 RepID=A0A3B0USY0_9ZZZZ
MTHIYRCEITLQEATFFSSREISNTYYTEPLLGNYALAYAFGFAQSPYFNQGEIRYVQDLGGLNEQGIYVTPGTLQGSPRFTFGQFNAQPDAYWFAFANNAIVSRSDGSWMEKAGPVWYEHRPGARRKIGLENRPQYGRIRMLAIGNRAVCHIISQEPLTLPRYIRLGKFMSKARVTVTKQPINITQRQELRLNMLLNPADLPSEYRLSIFDLITVPPTPLVQNVILSGSFYALSNGNYLPVGMRFGVELLERKVK